MQCWRGGEDGNQYKKGCKTAHPKFWAKGCNALRRVIHRVFLQYDVDMFELYDGASPAQDNQATLR